MEIKVYTTNKEPDDIAPFSMATGRQWKLYDAGQLNPTEMMLLLVLYRNVNPYEGKGRASYERICTWMKKSPSPQNANTVNKMMQKMRDELKLVWFPKHIGIKDFEYVLADFKRAKKTKEEAPDWVDIKPHFQTSRQSDIISTPESRPEPVPRQTPPIQRLEHRNNGGATRIGEIMARSEIRPPYTNTDYQT